MQTNLKGKTIIFTANSSWYLYNYRSVLIDTCHQHGAKIIIIAPKDYFSGKLAKNFIFVPWRISRSMVISPFHFIKSCVRLLLLIRAVKPDLIHSHTLKPNVIVAAASYLYNIPSVISFSGMGRLSTSKGISKWLFIGIVRTVSWFSAHSFRTAIKGIVKRNVQYIVQNPNDEGLLRSLMIKKDKCQIDLIAGSGVPNRLLKTFSPEFSKKEVSLVYCGRFLKSKGIDLFAKYTAHRPDLRSYIYGVEDNSSPDSVSKTEIEKMMGAQTRMIGYAKDPLVEHCNNSVLIVASNYGEGLPRTILEAFACGIPVIATRMSLCSYIPESLVTILNDVSLVELEKSVNSIIHSIGSEEFERIRAECNRFARLNNEYSVALRTISVYDSILKSNSTSRFDHRDIESAQCYLPK